MAIIVEDGTGKPDANSFVSVDEFKEYAEARGVDSGKYNDAAISSNLLLGAEYITALEPKFQGFRSNVEQGLAFPRVNVSYNGQSVSPVSVPRAVKLAQMSAAMSAIEGLKLFPTADAAPIKEDTIGPITTIYDTSVWQAGTITELPAVSALLKLYMNGPLTFSVRRV